MNSLRTLYSWSSDIHLLLCKYYDLVNWFYKEKTLSICRAWFNCFVFPRFLTLHHYSVVTTASLMTIIPQPRSKAHQQSKYNWYPSFSMNSCYTLVWYWSRYLYHTISGRLGTIIIPDHSYDVNMQWTCLTKNTECSSWGTFLLLKFTPVNWLVKIFLSWN